MNSSPQPRRPALAAAVEVFAECGYSDTSVDDLLKAMTLDDASFRRRFAGKEGCFLQAYDRIVAIAHARLAAAVPDKEPWSTRLAVGLHCLCELLDAHPAAARLVLIESQFAGEAALKRNATTLARLAPFMREGRETFALSNQAPPITDSVLPGGVAFSLRCQMLRGNPIRALYPEMLLLLLLPYLGQAETEACLAQSTWPRRPTADGSAMPHVCHRLRWTDGALTPQRGQVDSKGLS